MRVSRVTHTCKQVSVTVTAGLRLANGHRLLHHIYNCVCSLLCIRGVKYKDNFSSNRSNACRFDVVHHPSKRRDFVGLGTYRLRHKITVHHQRRAIFDFSWNGSNADLVFEYFI